jgi:hypothetical protein
MPLKIGYEALINCAFKVAICEHIAQIQWRYDGCVVDLISLLRANGDCWEGHGLGFFYFDLRHHVVLLVVLDVLVGVEHTGREEGHYAKEAKQLLGELVSFEDL